MRSEKTWSASRYAFLPASLLSSSFFASRSSAGFSSLCMRHFWWNAGEASESITVPCMPLIAIVTTPKRCALIFGAEMKRPFSRCSARTLGMSSVGAPVFSMPFTRSGLPG